MSRTFVILVALLSSMAMLSGCASRMTMESLPKIDEEKVAAYLQDKPEELHPMFIRVVAEDERNHVLSRLRAGLAAMELGYDDLAARTFDEALLTIETIYGGDEKAAKARGLFTAEDRKVFRGEPYERAMAYYYWGILYLKEGDYENARASFKSGILQDTLAEQEEYRQDFALLEYLEGWASQCNGDMDLAKEAYALAKSHNPALTVPNASDNLLVLADLGYAPVKYMAGGHGELLKIRASSKRGPESARVRLGDRSEPLANEESVLRQAVTRGGREFDSILAGKVNFKESAEAVAEAGMAVSTVATSMGAMQMATGDYDAARMSAGVGAVAGMFSLIASGAASATETAADTRGWDNLPERVVYGAWRRDGSASVPKVEFDDGSENARPTHRGGDEACAVVWARSQDGASGDIDIWKRVAGKTYRGDVNRRINVSGARGTDKIEISFSWSGKYTPIYDAVGGTGLEWSINDWRVEDGKVILRESGSSFGAGSWGRYGVGEFKENVLIVRGKEWGKNAMFNFPPADFIARLEEIEQ